MDKLLVILILVANLLPSNGEEEILQYPKEPEKEKSAYSYGYGVSDGVTGDVKTVWESRDGDTVKGHYTIVEPGGATRTVEYTAGPKTGFQASINSDDIPVDDQTSKKSIESKTMRNFENNYDLRNYERNYNFRDNERNYDFYEEIDNEHYDRNRKKPKRPQEMMRYKPNKKRSKNPSYSNYPLDSEASEYHHTIAIKHPNDYFYGNDAVSQMNYNTDPNCNKNSKENYRNKDMTYSNIDLDMSKEYPSDSFRDAYDKYAEPSYEYDQYVKYYDSDRYKEGKYGYGHNRYKEQKYNEYKAPGSVRYTYPVMPDMPVKAYEEDYAYRPKKKRPYKHRGHHYPSVSDTVNEYVLVPKKKVKKPISVETYDYRDVDDEYEQSEKYHSSTYEEEPKEIIRKIVQKRKKPINILDILDI